MYSAEGWDLAFRKQHWLQNWIVKQAQTILEEPSFLLVANTLEWVSLKAAELEMATQRLFPGEGTRSSARDVALPHCPLRTICEYQPPPTDRPTELPTRRPSGWQAGWLAGWRSRSALTLQRARMLANFVHLAIDILAVHRCFANVFSFRFFFHLPPRLPSLWTTFLISHSFLYFRLR